MSFTQWSQHIQVRVKLRNKIQFGIGVHSNTLSIPFHTEIFCQISNYSSSSCQACSLILVIIFLNGYCATHMWFPQSPPPPPPPTQKKKSLVICTKRKLSTLLYQFINDYLALLLVSSSCFTMNTYIRKMNHLSFTRTSPVTINIKHCSPTIIWAKSCTIDVQ